MRNYSVFEAGVLNILEQHVFEHQRMPFAVSGKLFLQEKLGLTGMEISLNKLPAQAGIPFLHRHHRNEEVYIFLSGKGEFQVDGEIFPLQEGTTVRIAPAGERGLRNTGETDLIYVVIQAPEGSLHGKTIDDGAAIDRKVQW